MTPKRSDRELLESFLAGDSRAFDLLYARHKQAVYSVIRSRLPPADAEEVHQEVWLKVAEGRGLEKLLGSRDDVPSRGRLDNAHDFRRWISRIAVNAALDKYRREKSQARRMESAAREPEPASTETHADPVLRRKLQRVLRKLEAKQRRLLVARELEGYTHDEMARELGTHAGKVNARLHEARKQCRRLLEPARRELGLSEPRRAPTPPRPDRADSNPSSC